MRKPIKNQNKELNEKVALLEDSKKALLNLLEDFDQERKKASEAEAKSAALLSSIGEGVIAVDESGHILFLNPTAEQLLGISLQEVAGKIFTEVIVLQDAQGGKLPIGSHPLAQALQTGRKILTTTTTTTTTTLYMLRKDGTRFPASIVPSPIFSEGKLLGAIKLFRDITKEKEIDAAKNEFIALTSHQLRTPLSTIKWYLEMVLSGDAGQLTPEQATYLREVESSNERMIRLVNALLNVSRIELGTFTVEPELTDVRELIRHMLHENEPRIQEKKLKMVVEIAKQIPTMQIDRQLFSMIFQNVLLNAIQYTPSGGRIKVSVSKVNSQLSIVVADTGIGIPAHQQDKIFTKLFRADNARTTDAQGSGLGLYIAKSILEHSGGRIWFESPTFVAKTSAGKKENKGTTFYVILPVTGMQKKGGEKDLAM